jgi:hypothetical protein
MNSTFFSIVLFIASAGLFFGFVNPQYMSFKNNQTQLALRETALQNAKQLDQTLSSLEGKRNNVTTDQLSSIARFLPDGVDSIRLIMNINSIADKHGVIIKKISIDANSSNSNGVANTLGSNMAPHGTVTFAFSFSTTYDNGVAFISDMEHSLQLMDVTSLSIKANDVGPYDFSVNAQTYWLKS